VRALFGLGRLGSLLAERTQGVPSSTLASAVGDGYVPNQARVSQQIQALREELRSHRVATIGMDGFFFHYHRPPLRSIDFAELKPSNSIRMPMVSIFADLDGYTRYIDQAMATNKVADAVRDLHVIRGELNAVLQEDFAGRKVRFIGDCIHGLVAQGSSTQADVKASVEQATACVGALRSSFDLCLEHLPTAGNLGLAIGYELGATPVSRIGLRGERAVRVASSLATLTSEQCQSGCTGEQTKIGPAAYAEASLETRRLFGSSHVGTDITYDSIAMSVPAGTAASAEPVAEARHHSR
jgi:class 3 adenylate cyclase